MTLALACTDPNAPPASKPSANADSVADTGTAPAESPPESGPTDSSGPDSPGPDSAPEAELCAEVDNFGAQFSDAVATWTTQDDLAPPSGAPLILVGSSSARRWEDWTRLYAGYNPLQRGMGGAQLGEIAGFTQELVTRHDPRAVLVYAGTNDLAAGVSAEIVVDRFRCLRHRIGAVLGWDRPVFYLGILPTPSRWDQWESAESVNRAIGTIAETDPAVVLVDASAPFLATGSPPSDTLFVDGLHLSDAGYALWHQEILAAVASRVSLDPAPAVAPLAPGTVLRVDLGPDNADDGERTPCPDWRGNCWNNWHSMEGDGAVLPGEHLDQLADTTGTSTGIGLTIAGGFYANGRSNGGLLWPDPERLGDLAVGSATGDYFYIADEDVNGALYLRGLDPGARYTLRLFAAREDPETRVSRYRVYGASVAEASLQTSGAGAGSTTALTNDDTAVSFTGLAPDAWGNLFVDVEIEAGTYAYLSLLELTVE